MKMEKFENVDYNELGFDPHIYGLLTGSQGPLVTILNATFLCLFDPELSRLEVVIWHAVNSLLVDLVGSYRSQRISKSKQRCPILFSLKI
ncbi:hypothetical protein Syun_019687 [Stephania yunnanensis]|uniref:Uncharacterized protein n=1 Tax=Stephania yunnanensis TaxID=152371 RepID=A0AAP0IVR7_9MAGN